MLLTCDKIGMMELADGVRLVPGDAVPEVAVEHRETLLREHPGVADVYLKQTASIWNSTSILFLNFILEFRVYLLHSN